MTDNSDKELKEYWQEAYSGQSERVAYVSPAGEDVTELESRIIRNSHMVVDFLTHAQCRPARMMNELFCTAKSCVEVGCGTGEFLAYLMEMSPIMEGLGIDLSETAIEHARATHKPTKEGQNLAWGVTDATQVAVSTPFDVLIANQVVEHFRNPAALIKRFQELAQYVLVITPYKERIPKWGADILDGSDNHLVSIDESTYGEFDVLEDMVFFSKEGWGVSREGECPLQYAALIKGKSLWCTFK